MYDQSGDIVAVEGFVTDITSRVEAEKALEENERRYMLATEAGAIGVWDMDLATRKIIGDKSLKTILGWEDHEVENSYEGYMRLVHPDDLGPLETEIRNNIAGLTPQFMAEHRLLRKDGSYHWVLTRGSALWDDNGKPYRVVGTSTDIMERKQVELALRESELKYRSLTENLDELIYRVDAYTNEPIYLSSSVERIFGYTIDEWSESPGLWRQSLHPDDREKTVAAYEKARKTGVRFMLEYRIITKDGTIKWIDDRVSWERDSQGRISTASGILTDITVRKQAEAALRANEERYRILYNNTPVMLQSINPEGTLVGVSDYWLKAMRYTRDEVIGHKLVEFLTEESKVAVEEIYLPKFLREGRLSNVDLEYVTKTGEVLSALVSTIAERDEAGRIRRSLGVVLDVTDRKRAEDRLRESEQLYRSLVETMNDGLGVADEEAAVYVCKSETGRYAGLRYLRDDRAAGGRLPG